MDKKVDESYYGVPLTDIPDLIRTPPVLVDMQAIHGTQHTFMIKPFKYNSANPDLEPEPIHGIGNYCDIWNDDYVRLPCSPFNLNNDGTSRWLVIKKALTKLKQKCDEKTVTVNDIKTAIESYNDNRLGVGCLEHLIDHVYTTEESNIFKFTILPNMIHLTLTVDKICSQPPPLLRIGTNRSVTMSKLQAASLLSCAFFCVFPDQFNGKSHNQSPTYQSLNFIHLLKSGSPWKVQKLICILHYFRRITENIPKGVLTFRRCGLPTDCMPNWIGSQKPLSKIHLVKNKTIEEMHGLLQIDFANEFIGGGVMDEGIVQEEIRFTICPEMLVSILFCEVMRPNECIHLIGCEQFVTYSGYATSFKAKGNFDDKTLKDSWGRKLSHVVAMDALYYSNTLDQYTVHCMSRELMKAYTSFRLTKSMENCKFGIATGNWGCGAFNGDRHLKAIIQLMAASQADRPLVYCTFNNQEMLTEFWIIYKYLIQQQVTVGDLCLYLQEYSKQYDRSSLFEYIFMTSLTLLKK